METESKHYKVYKIYKNSCFYKSLISLPSNAKTCTGTNLLWSKNVNIKLIYIKHSKSKSLLHFLSARILNKTHLYVDSQIFQRIPSYAIPVCVAVLCLLKRVGQFPDFCGIFFVSYSSFDFLLSLSKNRADFLWI